MKRKKKAEKVGHLVHQDSTGPFVMLHQTRKRPSLPLDGGGKKGGNLFLIGRENI